MEVRIMGVKEADAYLARLNGGVDAASKAVVVAGTDTAYAFGQEFGRYRSGRLARKSGGTFALTDAYKDVKPTVAGRVARALPKGPVAVRYALMAAGMDVLTRTKQLLIERLYSIPVPERVVGVFTRGKRKGQDKTQPQWRRTGNLRRSYHLEVDEGHSLRAAYTSGGQI